MSDHEVPAEQPLLGEREPKTVTPEITDALAASALTELEPSEHTVDPNELIPLIEAGILVVNDPESPDDKILEWQSLVASIPTSPQTDPRLLTTIEAFTTAVGRRARRPQRLDASFIEQVLASDPRLGKLPIRHLPQDAENIVLSHQKSRFTISEMVKRVFGYSRVRPQSFADLTNLLATMVDTGDLGYTGRGMYFIVQHQERIEGDASYPASEPAEEHEPTLEEKLRAAGLNSSGRPKTGKVSSENSRTGATGTGRVYRK